MKKLLIAGAIAVALVAGGALLLLSNLNSLVAKAIEKHGSEVTETSVRVSGVDISLREGRGAIQGLTIANPDGFDARTAFSLGHITIDIDLKSARAEPVVIEEVRVRAPVVTAEITKTGASNLDELRKRVARHAAGTAGRAGEPSAKVRRIRIVRFVFAEGRVDVDASALGLEGRTLELPSITLDNIGGPDGAAPDEIASAILTALAGKATSQIAVSGVQRLLEQKLGGSLTDKAKDWLEKGGR